MKGKVVLVTGASSGLGAETAILLAGLGCKLSLVDKDPAHETMERCISAGLTAEDVLVLEVDLTDIERGRKSVEDTVAHFGQLDVLVNNAGIARHGSLKDSTEKDYDDTMRINTKTVFFMSQSAIPYLIISKGNIVNVSSIYGIRPNIQSAAYCVSKAAVNQVTQCSALELASQQVRVNAVNPGHVKTGLYKASGMLDETTDTFLENLKQQYPMGRIGTTMDVAKAIVFLADDSQSGFITGVCLPVDGGYCLGRPRV